ncbi:hypothetical protein B0H21DRAFT_36849 [Amylocystis lapponica]|nr:hypothetical protein B0H21DRAFT_36849 [Amylocystis lapponica]
MDVDQQPKYILQPTNTLAGPSSTPDAPPLFLSPPGPPRPIQYFSSTQDLLARFQLSSAYDKYVRPYVTPVVAGAPQPVGGATDKGKGKEVLARDVPASSSAPSQGTGNDADDEDGKEKKGKNTYRHLIKGIPGKHSMKKDEYLLTMMQVPPKQRIAIVPFDLRTQREAFAVGLDGLKGWNINALVAESPQAREDRKKRKELRKHAKAQGQTPVAGSGTSYGFPATPATTATPTPGVIVTTSGTPKTGTGASAKPPPGSIANPSQPRGRTPVGIGTPQSLPTPGPGPNVPAAHPPAAATAPIRHAPVQAPSATPAGSEPKRGQKREREHSADGHMNGIVPAQGQVYAQTGNTGPKAVMVVNAKAGTAGVRPRPLKKQRMDTKGQAREMPVQQPTPHA